MKDKPNQTTLSWQSMTSAEVLSALSVSEAGLSQAEAELRLKKYGINQLTLSTGRGLIKSLARLRSR